MRYVRFFFAVLVLTLICLNPNLKAQFTLNEDDFRSKIGTEIDVSQHHTEDTAGVSTILEATGKNATYDFTQLSGFTQQGTGTYTITGDPSSYPGYYKDELSEATLAIKHRLSLNNSDQDTTFYTFASLNNKAYYQEGFVQISKSDLNDDGVTPDTLFRLHKPNSIRAKFPLEYGTTWKDTMDTETFINSQSSFAQTQRLDAEVTGYGTLKLPGGTTVECLRLRMKKTTEAFGQQTVTRSIQFVGKDTRNWATIQFKQNSKEASKIIYNKYGEAVAIADDKSHEKARAFTLKQNYPNPFNPTTTIGYRLKSPTRVKLTILSPTGRPIRTLVNKTQSRGRHRITFDARNLSSGLYLYRLQTPAYSKTKKMLLVK